MKPLRIAKHELFAQFIAAGDTHAAAYRQAYRSNSHSRYAAKHGHRLLQRPDVSARIAYLQQRAAKKINWSLEQRLAFLKEAILTPPDQITASSPLCLGTKLTPHGVELKLIDKKAAIDLYSKLVGDFKDKPEPVLPTPLGQIISRIRARKDP